MARNKASSNPLDLPEDTVDLWRLCLEQPPEVVERFSLLLNTEEKARAARFRFDRDQTCYILTRGVLRHLLGGYLQLPADELSFEVGEHGKPALSGAKLEFNVSHSGSYSLLGFCRGRRVGVDVEEIRPRKSVDLVAEHHFADGELAGVLEAEGDERLTRFYRCWTRKEAYMKATGMGLAVGLKSFEVSVGEEAKLVWTERGDADAWQLSDVEVADGYAGATCVAGDSALEIRYTRVSPLHST